jgi:hypothetical protein
MMSMLSTAKQSIACTFRIQSSDEFGGTNLVLLKTSNDFWRRLKVPDGVVVCWRYET